MVCQKLVQKYYFTCFGTLVLPLTGNGRTSICNAYRLGKPLEAAVFGRIFSDN